MAWFAFYVLRGPDAGGVGGGRNPPSYGQGQGSSLTGSMLRVRAATSHKLAGKALCCHMTALSRPRIAAAARFESDAPELSSRTRRQQTACGCRVTATAIRTETRSSSCCARIWRRTSRGPALLARL